MHRLLRHLAGLLLALSLGLGSVAHAAETIGCTAAAEAVAGKAIGHVDGDEDQVPADAGKAYPHHHASCHGHHLASPCAEAMPVSREVQLAVPAAPFATVLVGAVALPMLHPPKA